METPAHARHTAPARRLQCGGGAPGGGVTDHTGEVFRFDNLFVLDGSVIPRAIGRNPLTTIAAAAERSCKQVLEQLPLRPDGTVVLA